MLFHTAFCNFYLLIVQLLNVLKNKKIDNLCGMNIKIMQMHPNKMLLKCQWLYLRHHNKKATIHDNQLQLA